MDSIAAQTTKPDEVIVVDNNSTDDSIKIARSYKFVRIVMEKHQGRAYARNMGFNAARCEILGRIDADSRLAPDWVERVKEVFANPTVAGVTGLGKTNVLPWSESLYSKFWSRIYYWTVHLFFGVVTMWGANMAVRQNVWEEVKAYTCLDDSAAHEDQDLSLLIAERGGRIIQDNNLVIQTNGQAYHYWPKLYEYIKRIVATKKLHNWQSKRGDSNIAWLNFWRLLPGGLVGWTLTVFYCTGALLIWPIDALLMRLNKFPSR